MRNKRVTIKRTVLCLLACMLIAGFGLGGALLAAASAHGREAGEHPFALHALERGRWSTWSGVVVERLRAGPYSYLRVQTTEREVWVVTLGAAPDARAAVRVTVVGRAVHFASPRLHRTFDELLFAIVRPSPSLASHAP